MRFTDVVAQWPGSTHDNTMFDNCALKVWMDNHNEVGWLLGDAGYALKAYLMTPKIRPATAQEAAYNLAHSRSRMVVERAFGLLKSRFRCLHKTGGFLQVTPEKAAKVFVVCTKLHNMCIDGGMVFDGNVLVAPDNAPPYVGAPDRNAHRAREALIARFNY